MRFERFHLRAFGPFTDEVLDLSGGAPGGLHVIYGPNEAGKSTSLRAVTGFLFGIPQRTSDAHLHPISKLSISAVISADGVTQELTRLKRRKDDLVSAAGEPLLENPLPVLLGNLDEKSFTARFGLDQVELERGAEALLGGSEQGLFAAGTAGAAVRRVLDELLRATEELYRQRGTKPPLNRALSEYERTAREARRAERPPEKWLEQKREHEEALTRVIALKKERLEVRAELRRLNRLRGVLSDLTAWEEAHARRATLGEEPSLPEDATLLRERSERILAESRVEERHLRSELETFEGEMRGLPPESPLVEVDDEQLQLSNRAGTALSARKDLPKRQASLLEQTRQVRELLSDLGVTFLAGEELAKAREMLPSARTISVVRALATEYGALATAEDAALRAYVKKEREVTLLEEPVSEGVLPPSALAELEAAVADAQAASSQFQALMEEESELGRSRAEVMALRAELGTRVPWSQLAAVVPGPAATAALAGRFRALLVEKAKLEEHLGFRRQQKGDIEARLTEERRGDVPSEERLAVARESRDEKLARLERDPVAAGFSELRGAIAESDNISDRLRLEADRVAAISNLQKEARRAASEVLSLQEELSQVEGAIEAARENHARLTDRLGLGSRTEPSEADAVFERVRLLVQFEAKCESQEKGCELKRQRIRKQEERLSEHLPAELRGGQLPALMVSAGKILRESLKATERERQRASSLARAHRELEEALSSHAEASRLFRLWESKWQKEVLALGLSAQATVQNAQDALASFDRLGRVLLEADNLERRIAGMERDTDALAEDVRGILKRHLPELLAADPVDAALQLQEQIRLARRARDERTRYRKLIEERKAALAKVESTILAAESQLAQLVRVAGVEDASYLPAAEERRREIRTLERRLETLETAIREKAEGSTLAELQTEAQEWRGRSGPLNQRVYELEEQIEELEEAYRAAEKSEADLKLGLSVYHSEDVVEARQRVSTHAAEARSLLREYLVKKSALALLRRQMDTYAEQFSGPILRRASEKFERLTLGRYAKLSVGLGERTLHCVRDGQQLDVSQLSRGTRAQLYFALRLASLETYFEKQPAIPLVFDDLFVDFDDDRTTSAFEVLSELAQKVQVLYFTHLARDVEAAHNAVPPGLLFGHRLTVT